MDSGSFAQVLADFGPAKSHLVHDYGAGSTLALAVSEAALLVVVTDWDAIHRAALDSFRTGFDRPHPHAWDGLLDEAVRFVQPMLRDGAGPPLWWEESARTLSLLPDLRADVLDWSGHDELLFIHLRFTTTLAGRPLTWTAVDLLRLSTEGKLLHRESFFDSVSVTATLLRRPRSWRRWWRSGVGPLAARRRVLPSLPDCTVPTPIHGGT